MAQECTKEKQSTSNVPLGKKSLRMLYLCKYATSVEINYTIAAGHLASFPFGFVSNFHAATRAVCERASVVAFAAPERAKRRRGGYRACGRVIIKCQATVETFERKKKKKNTHTHARAEPRITNFNSTDIPVRARTPIT